MSIGLPVRNGEGYLREALDSLLGQDYPNLEVIASDNASEDATREICLDYTQRDPRLVYVRAETNMGAIWNFNRVLELARGEYFMWAAFDDLRHPRYVSATVAALASSPTATLCCTDILFVDEAGDKIDVRPALAGVRPVGATPRDRLRLVARAEHWYDFYGLTRTSSLRQTRGAIPTWGFDVVVLLELCLRGEVLKVPEPLFTYRRFSTKSQDDLATGLSGQGIVPVCWSCLTLELLHSVWLAPLGAATKVAMWAEFVFWFCIRNRPVAAAIRTDITRAIKDAGSTRAWGRLIKLLFVGAMIYPLQNRLTRAVYRRIIGTKRSRHPIGTTEQL